jgi:hypothetical protein
MWFAQDAAAPERRRDAEHESRANGHGLGVRARARVLKTHEATASLQYGRSAR